MHRCTFRLALLISLGGFAPSVLAPNTARANNDTADASRPHNGRLRRAGALLRALPHQPLRDSFSEAMAILPWLTKPLRGQMEQESNARALHQLGYALVVGELSREGLQQWLERWSGHTGYTPRLECPDVADALARWLATGADTDPAALARDLWRQTRATPASGAARAVAPGRRTHWQGQAA